MSLDLASHAETKERIPGKILAELESVEDSAEVEEGVRQFIEWVKNGKLEVRVFPSGKLHAKLYVMTFVDGHIDKGRVVTGSSNFSESGLAANLEFNVELKNRSDYDFALAKFNELWQVSRSLAKLCPDHRIPVAIRAVHAVPVIPEVSLRILQGRAKPI